MARQTVIKKTKTIKAWVFLKTTRPILWEWWCCPFLNVKITGKTKTLYGSQRAAKRTIERLGFKAEVESFKFVPTGYYPGTIR